MRCHQPCPIAYVPVWNFDHLGGPGNVRAETRHTARPWHRPGSVPVAQDRAVDVTSTGVDFFQPHLDTAINFVAGYRVPPAVPDPFFTAWRQMALEAGRVLLDRREQGHARRPSPIPALELRRA